MKKIRLTLMTSLFAYLFASCSSSEGTRVVLSNETQFSDHLISSAKVYSGEKAFFMSPENEWGPSWKMSKEELGLKELKNAQLEFKLNGALSDTIIAVLTALGADDQPVFYHGVPAITTIENGWSNMRIVYPELLPFPEDQLLQVYFWNQKKKEFYIDNVVLTVK